MVSKSDFITGVLLEVDRGELMNFRYVCIDKWPFLPGSAFSAGFRLRHTGSMSHRKPLCGLDPNKNCSFMNWKRTVPFYNCVWALAKFMESREHIGV